MSSSSWSWTRRPSAPSSNTYPSISTEMRRTISARCSTVATSRNVTRSSISSADREALTASRRALYRSRIWRAWSARAMTRGVGSIAVLKAPTWIATSERSSDTVTTGTGIWRATRSAVRWRVPVSAVGMFGSGTRCTLARTIREQSAVTMIAPSILASSESRWGVNSASRRNPPEQTPSTSGPAPNDQQGAHAGLDDALDALAQRGAGGDEPQGGEVGFRSRRGGHHGPGGRARETSGRTIPRRAGSRAGRGGSATLSAWGREGRSGSTWT